MLRDRNDMTHIYDGGSARELVKRILGDYIPEFVRLQKEMETCYKDKLDEL